MICVTIGRGRHKQMILEHQQMVELGAELVELRVDYIVRKVNVQRLIKDRPGPVVVTCRRQSDGGRWNESEEARLTLLRSAIADQVEYVDLEEDIAGDIPRFGPTKRIVSLHDFEKTPSDLRAIHTRLAALDPDIIKIATLANNPHDNLRMLQLVSESKIPTIGICMGDMGTPSRILANKVGAPFTYCTYNRDRVMAPGQLSFQQMRDEYNYDSINADTEVFGVIADPVGHSLSPLIHNAAFKHANMNRVYVPFRVPSEHLRQFMEDCPARDIRGLSVTIPHKESVLEYCHEINGAVQGIGATNTLVMKKTPEGIQRLGFNTDYKAAMNCLDARLGTAERKTPLAGHVALVLGAGGAARAIAFGLERRGADVVVASRTHGRALVLAEQLGCRATKWENRHNIKHEVLVNATPVGMHPKLDATPYDKTKLRPNSLVFDTVYNPEHTLLIKNAKARKCRVITGMEMFVGQAALQFQLFTGEPARVDVMRETVKRAIGAVKPTPSKG